jgi:hypothetical protein
MSAAPLLRDSTIAMYALECRSIPVILTGLLLASGCGTMTPDSRARDDIFWEAATACESRYRTLHIDRIDREGNVSMHADAESRHELPAFNECYRHGIRAQVEARKRAGLPVPDVPQEPTGDLD